MQVKRAQPKIYTITFAFEGREKYSGTGYIVAALEKNIKY